MDSFGRHVDYLRISITDRCNERCLYCMPEGYRGWATTPDHLTAAEIVRVVRVAAGLGFRKFRLTGGEPLVRRDVVDLVRALAAIPGVDCLALSTNGTRLAPVASALHAAGLRTANVSLDALDPALYRRITGGDVAQVLAGIRAALAAGFERIKLNCVLMRGVNEGELWPLARFAAEHDLPLRVIELMPLTSTEVLGERNFFSVAEAMRMFSAHDELVAVPDRRLGWGPARYFQLRRTGTLIGFIGALTTEHFCETCNKMRLTADGKIRPCLGDHGEFDLRTTLRHTSSDDELRALLEAALRAKPRAHQFLDAYRPCRPMTAIGG
ncbi:MAG TPA: GTP 3',8-cyclase MoaA [Opitutaceae bacterium]|nr:GTP 3',8-cyclase MoaA [Opitutaceae bacterium]